MAETLLMLLKIFVVFATARDDHQHPEPLTRV
jgi:hypothetical protein